MAAPAQDPSHDPGSECGISRLTRHQAVAAHYDKLAVHYAATVDVAMFGEWL